MGRSDCAARVQAGLWEQPPALPRALGMPLSMLSLAVPSPSPSQPSRPADLKQWGAHSLVFQHCWMDAHPGPALCCAQVCAPPKPSHLRSHARSKSGSAQAGGEGRRAGTQTPGTRCSFSFCISAASQERPVQVLPKHSRPVPQLPGRASFLNSKADNSITTSTWLRTALSSGQPYPHFSENQMFPLSTAPRIYLPF